VDRREIAALRAELPQRELFHYHSGRFAAELLKMVLPEQGLPVGVLRTSRFARLLKNDVVREALAFAGDGRLRPEHLDAVWKSHVSYWLTFDEWGTDELAWWTHCQTSRPGFNLVVQLNFAKSHDRVYRETVRPEDREPFVLNGHPVSDTDLTLAWARVDVDRHRRFALIEEVQSDWLRGAEFHAAAVRWYARTGRDRWAVELFGPARRDVGRIARYERALAPHRSLWAEALLTATVTRLRRLGVTGVYMHSPQSGVAYKQIDGNAPPASLYRDVPRRFAFERDVKAPAFIEVARARIPWLPRGGRMWRLDLRPMRTGRNRRADAGGPLRVAPVGLREQGRSTRRGATSAVA
jgi:hypothetical protein